MKIRNLLCKTPPVVIAVVLSSALIVIRICLVKAVAHLHPTASGSDIRLLALGSFSEVLLIGCLLYALLLYIAKQRKDIASLNHEIRNALQVIVYTIPSSGPATQPAKEAVERVKRAVEEVSRG